MSGGIASSKSFPDDVLIVCGNKGGDVSTLMVLRHWSARQEFPARSVHHAHLLLHWDDLILRGLELILSGLDLILKEDDLLIQGLDNRAISITTSFTPSVSHQPPFPTSGSSLDV